MSWATTDTEKYYQNFIELQDKLRKSEEERLQLEMKYNEMMQVTQGEQQLYFRRLRSQYKRYVEENEKRLQRNARILQMLERIENRAFMLEAKTRRFQLLRHQYLSYLERVKRTTGTTGSTHEHNCEVSKKSPENIKEKFRDVKISDGGANKVDDGSHLQNLEDRNRYPPRFQEPSSQFINQISIADDILRSIHERKRKKMLTKLQQEEKNYVTYDSDSSQSLLSVDEYKKGSFNVKFQVESNLEEKERCSNESSVESSDVVKKVKMQLSPNTHKKNFENFGKDNEIDEMITANKNLDLNQNVKSMNDKHEENVYLDLDDKKNAIDENPETYLIDNKDQKIVESKNVEPKIVESKNVEENELMKTEISTSYPEINEENAKTLNDNNANKINDKSMENLEIHQRNPEISYDENIKAKNYDKTQENSPKFYEKPDENLEIQNQNLNYDQTDLKYIPNTEEEQKENTEITNYKKEEIQYEENGQPIYNYDQNVENIYYNQDNQNYANGNEQELSNYQQNDQQQYDEQGQPLQYDPNISQQQYEVQYDEYGQPLVQYDANYDESAKQYDENGQEMIQYDENMQKQQQYDENGQLVQYDPNQQAYDVEYDENGQPVQYDANGQQQYDENGQIIQYDPNSQQQYDENGLVVQNEQQQEYSDQIQYDEDGQPIQYDENYAYNESAYEQPQDEQQQDEQQQEDQQYEEPHVQELEIPQQIQEQETTRNVLDLLETDTESTITKQEEITKTSNESDFEFSEKK